MSSGLKKKNRIGIKCLKSKNQKIKKIVRVIYIKSKLEKQENKRRAITRNYYLFGENIISRKAQSISSKFIVSKAGSDRLSLRFNINENLKLEIGTGSGKAVQQ